MRTRVTHRGALEVGDLVRGDGEDERLEGPAGVAVARQRAEHGDADLLREVLHEVPGVARQPGQPGAAVAQGEGVDMGEQIVRGLLVAVDGAVDERTDHPMGMSPRRRASVHGALAPL